MSLSSPEPISSLPGLDEAVEIAGLVLFRMYELVVDFTVGVTVVEPCNCVEAPLLGFVVGMKDGLIDGPVDG